MLPRSITSIPTFAPALVHSQSIAGDRDRADVRLTSLDLYYVPKLRNPRLFATLDPAMNVDWEKRRSHPSLTVTAGTMVGKAFGGDAQVYLKPSVLMGVDRPLNWSLRAGAKLLNF